MQVFSLQDALKSLYSAETLQKLRVIADPFCPRDRIYMIGDGALVHHPTFTLEPFTAIAEPLAVGIAATCAIAGLGMLIARRNAVMAAEGPSESWLKAFVEWACAFVRALFKQPPALPAHTES